MHWKSKKPPTTRSWHSELVRWGSAESAAIRREEARGIRKLPIAMEWDIMLEAIKNLDLGLNVINPTSQSQ